MARSMNRPLGAPAGTSAEASASIPTERCDAALVRRGLAASRTRAQALIRKGAVSLNGAPVRKASQHVLPHDELRVDAGDDYVSRGALKLVGAFDVFDLPSPRGRECLDIGASTGGFTEVLVRRGAARVTALDVGHGQLAPRVARDPHVLDMSGVNVRDVEATDLPAVPSFIVSDVSFISLTYVIPVIRRILDADPTLDATIVLLVKPQFEVGKGHLGKNGIVRDEARRDQAVRTVRECARSNGFTERGFAPSPILGTHGNEEFLLWLSRPARSDRAEGGDRA